MTKKVSTANNTSTDTVRNCVAFLIDYFQGLSRNPLATHKAQDSLIKLHGISKNLDDIDDGIFKK